MRTEYLKYKDYKKIDHILLEGMPTGWELKKIKFVGDVKMGQSPKSEDCNKLGNGTPFLQGNADFGVISPTATSYCETANKVSLDGDILFSVRAPVGALNISDKQYGIGRGLCSLTASNIQSRFLWFALQVYRLELKSLATGSTYDAISIDEVSNIKILVPSPPEQTRIASFLDQKTAQIDKLIAQKEKLLKLLAEKRTAIITQAVTKGLDPNVEMKDSGIDWLGEIPKDWDVKKLKFLASYNDEKLNENEDPDLEIKYVEIGSVDLIDGITAIEELKFENAPSRARRIAKEGDVIISTVRTYLKAISFINKSIENLIVSTGFAVLRSKDISIIHPKYLGYCTQDQRFVEKIVSKSVGVSYPAISPYEITEISIAYPDLKEQIVVIEFLENKLAQQDKIQQRIQTSLVQLKEYREALITAAVTGQIDVRKEVVNE